MGACIGCGEERPLGGADGQMLSGDGEPCGEGKGDGGAAVFIGGIWARGAGFALLRGGVLVTSPGMASMPSIMLSLLKDLFLPYRSIASVRPISFCASLVSSLLNIRHPTPETSSSSSCISSSPASPSRNVARAPPGKRRGNSRRDRGRCAWRRG